MRWLICMVTVAVAVIAQLTVVDRITFPGGTGPDLVLIAVAALALAGGPLAGALIGFCAGLALDVAPPGSHFVGQYALVFCLIGYACGLFADVPSGDGTPEQGHTALFEIVITAAGVVCGEALVALLGVTLSDPRVTWPAVTQVLPVAAVYDVVLCPFVLFAAAAALRLAGSRSQRGRPAWSARLARTSVPGAVRQVSGGTTPRLRLSERGKGEGWIGGARGALAQTAGGRSAPKREPRLNLARNGSLAHSSSLVRGGTRPGALGAAFATGGLAGSGLTSSRFGRSRMGRSLLGGSVFSRSPSALTRPAPRSRPATLGRSAFLDRSSFLGGFGSSRFSREAPLGTRSLPSRRLSPFRGSSSAGRVFAPRRAAGLLRSAPGGSAAGHVPRFARRSTLARLTGALRRSTRGRSGPRQPTLRQPTLRQPKLRQPKPRQPKPRQPKLRQPTLRHTTRRQPTLSVGKSPGRGWLRRTSSRRSGLGRDWTGGSAPRLGSGGQARLHMPRRRSKRSWRTGGSR